jgi:hypothetical protein
MMERRLERERRTIDTMIFIYCRGHHKGGPVPCSECGALQEYAHKRLASCRFGAEKPTCANCTVHCYKPEMRERVRQVMRYSGPRMLLRHPVMAVRHVRDGRRPAPELKKRSKSED